MLVLDPYRYASAPTDPDFAFVKALLDCTGVDEATSFPDVTGRTWTAVGGAETETDNYKFGGSSGHVATSSDNITTPNSTDFDGNSGEICFEGWYFNIGGGVLRPMWSQRNTSSGLGWELFCGTSEQIHIFGDVGHTLSTANGIIVPDTWQFIETDIFDDAGTMRQTIYVDGVCRADGVITISASDTATAYICGRQGGVFNFIGYFGPIRITRKARHTGRTVGTTYYTPPTGLFPHS